MSDAGDKLARNRQAILDHIARRQRKHDPHEEIAGPGYAGAGPGEEYPEDNFDPADGGEGWFGHLRHAVRTWWRYHPAHMAVDLATPLMRGYARRKPAQLLGISLAAGALLVFIRPWKLISIGGLIMLVLKSSQMSHLFTAALSASDYRKDHERSR